ncbi:hypothetical protein K525DRAFT_191949 [Schizophyllum commune Loenen D]|nr:hypothetical protein K525DRAFT_191949 [Schizophyllum commune Loenen D]
MTTAATTESPSKGATTSLEEYMRVQQDLVREASLALPHSFSQCTYSLGYIRQPVYLCQTCPEAKGVCASCSIACHADHEQIELFPKRHFRCDCPTTSIAHSCTLHRRSELENEENQYGQNFQGLFCRCHRTYDAATEREAMIQCLACEDWFHESCCNLRERPPPRGSTTPPETVAPEPTSSVPSTTASASPSNDDTASDNSDDDLPPALLTPDDYEAFVCGACVQRIEVLKRYAGSAEAVMVGRGKGGGWMRVDGEEEEVDVTGNEVKVDNEATPTVGEKLETQPSLCRAPRGPARGTSPSASGPRTDAAGKILEAVARGDYSLGTGDVFLTREDFRERWCRCEECLPSLLANKFLLEEEETWEPPEDEDSGRSLEELGLRALNSLPRDRAIDGIMHFNALKDHLVGYLRPFAQEGKVVGETDVRSFFAELMAARAKPAL